MITRLKCWERWDSQYISLIESNERKQKEQGVQGLQAFAFCAVTVYGCSNVAKLLEKKLYFQEKNMYDFYKNFIFLSKKLFFFFFK